MMRSTIFILIVLVLLLGSDSFAGEIRPIADRVDAIVSYPLVLSIQSENERDLRNGVTTRIDDGRAFNSPAYWVGLVPSRSNTEWTRSPGTWRAYSYEQISKTPIAQRPPGSWFIRVPLPIDAVGQGLWFEQTRFELNWLPDPERSLLEAPDAQRTRDFGRFWSMHLDHTTLADPAVQRAIDQFHHDPFQNWRARVLTDGLHPDRSRARETQSGLDHPLEELELALQEQDTPGADLLGAIARQQEARWQIILGRIWLIDPNTAERLKFSLMRTAGFQHRILPLWTADQIGLARLTHDLLSPFVDDETRVLRAKAWLETQPRAIAWVIDDQGMLRAGTDDLVATIGIVSLPGVPGDSLLRIDSPDFESPQLVTLPPSSVREIEIPVQPRPSRAADGMIDTQSFSLRLGHWSRDTQILASPVQARAPYIRIGPLLADWTMSALVNDRPLEGATLERDQTSVGLLSRVGVPDPYNPERGWRLYFELAVPRSVDPQLRANDLLTVWIGPRGYPQAVWEITPDQPPSFTRGSNPSIGIPAVESRTLNDRWIVQIDLPESVFDQDGNLMLGIERTDPNGAHSAWPRRMIPAQTEPGRLIIRPDQFDGF